MQQQNKQTQSHRRLQHTLHCTDSLFITTATATTHPLDRDTHTRAARNAYRTSRETLFSNAQSLTGAPLSETAHATHPLDKCAPTQSPPTTTTTTTTVTAMT